MITTYYERRSNFLNAYIKPECSGMGIDLPTFLSNDFIMFTPDIIFKNGDPGQSVYDCVVSGVKSLLNRSYIDGRNLGISGISFSGFSTNYLVVTTDIFNAACTMSGASDLISAYNSLEDEQFQNHAYYELGQGRMGATLWNKKSLYIKNSPSIHAENVETPLLLFHTSYDGIVNFSQGLEMFNALSRLGKKVWLLEYKYGNHGVRGKDGNDFSMRIMQFFNHYLKGKNVPVWMNNRAARKLGSIKSELDLDTAEFK
jgi:dipeptidyl aminopeptidase/acylaminoacyl peptidase